MKKILSLVMSMMYLLSLAAVPAMAETEPTISSVAYIGDSDSTEGWQKTLTDSLGAEATYVSAKNMLTAMPELPTIEAASPELVVIDASIAGSAEQKYFESILLSVQAFDKIPYVALISETAADASIAYVERLALNFDVDWICLEDLEGGLLKDELTYNKIDAPNPADKLSDKSSVIDLVSYYSGTLTDNEAAFDVYGDYIIVETDGIGGGTYSVTINGGVHKAGIADSEGISFYADNYGAKAQHNVIIKATGTVNITGVYASKAPEVAKDVIALGFEDNDLTPIRADGGLSVSAVQNIDGDAAVLAKKVQGVSDLSVPVTYELGKKYSVSAKVKPVSEFASIDVFCMQYINNDAGILTRSTAYKQSTVSNLKVGEWNKISAEFTPALNAYIGGGKYADVGTKYGFISFRAAGTDCEYYIDDIVIEPVVEEKSTKAYGFEIDFEDKTTGAGTLKNGNATYVENAGEDGGIVLEVPGTSTEIVNVANIYVSPNRAYTISFKVKGISQNSIGKYIYLFMARAGSTLRSDGTAAIINPPNESNYKNFEPAQITDKWQTVTYTYRSMSPYSDYEGKRGFFFRLCDVANDVNNMIDESITVQIDDFKVVPENIIYDGDFEKGIGFDYAFPGTTFAFEKIIGKDGQETNALKWTIGTGQAWAYQHLSLDPDKKYRLSYDYKIGNVQTTENNPHIESILDYYYVGGIGTNQKAKRKGFMYPGKTDTFSTEWQTVSREFIYSDEYGFKVAPSLQLRANGFTTGDYIYIDNFKIEEVPFDVITNISATELISDEKATVTFRDNLSYNIEYIYKIYSQDGTVYAAGVSDKTAISFNNYCSYGKTLYADIQYVSEFGEISDVYTKELGIVKGPDVKFSAVTGFATTQTDLYDGTVTGKVTVQNAESEKTIILTIAVYETDDNGNIIKLVSVNSKECELKPYENKTFEISPEDKLNADDNLCVKVFAWDSYENLTPLAVASSMNNL